MPDLPLHIVDNHLLIPEGEGFTLIDTGVPASVAAPPIVSQVLNLPVRRLMGCDEIRRAPFLIDWPARRLSIGSPAAEGVSIPLRRSLGIFTVEITTQAGPVTAILDTGAQLSYAAREAVAGLTPLRRTRDFYPVVGEFEVDVYTLPIVVGGRQLDVEFGVLPDEIRGMLSLFGMSAWILGTALFRDRKIILDLANNRLVDVTEAQESVRAEPAGGMDQAYRAARHLLGEELEPAERLRLESLTSEDIVVVRGAFDHLERVLDLAQVPYRLVQADAVGDLSLSPESVVMVNCPGKISARGLAALRRFVEAGGTLFTTDWALTYVVERAFPGFIKRGGRSTHDDVVAVEIQSADSPFLKGLLSPGAQPVWWLEGASYPIRIIDPSRVRVLLSSRELGERYGESPVAVSFSFGRGEVVHMISHYYLQRTELRSARHRGTATDYARELKLSAASLPQDLRSSVRAGELEAAHKSLRFVTNLLLEKKRSKSG